MLRLLLLALIWGWSFLFIKVAGAGMTAPTVAGLRIALGALVVGALLWARGQRLPRDRTSWQHFTVMAVVHSAVPFTLLAWAEHHITSALTAVLNAATPLFAATFTAAFLGERLRRAQASGLVLGFVGVAVAAGIGAGDLTGSSLGGAAAVLATAACYGIGFVYAKRHLVGVAPLTASTGQLLAATVLSAPVAAVTSAFSGIHLTFTRIVAIVLLGVVGTGAAYVLNYRSIAAVGPTRASVVTQLVPVVAVVVGVVFLDEPFNLRLVVGGALTLLGLALLHDRIRRFRAVPVQA